MVMKFTITILFLAVLFRKRSNALSLKSPLCSEQLSRKSVLTTILCTSTSFVLSPTKPSNAKSERIILSDDLRRIYDEGAPTYETLYSESIVSRTLDFPSLRQAILSKVRGDVLELGVGTGLNLAQYPAGDGGIISSYTAVDISSKMMEQAQEKFSTGSVAQSLERLYKQNKVDFRVGDVSALSELFQSKNMSLPSTVDGMKFDTIVDTFGLCVFPRPVETLDQARRLLKPGGQLLLLEHQDSLVGKALSPTRNIGDVISTCRYNDNVLGLLKDAGFKSTNISSKNIAGGFLLQVIAKV